MREIMHSMYNPHKPVRQHAATPLCVAIRVNHMHVNGVSEKYSTFLKKLGGNVATLRCVGKVRSARGSIAGSI